MLSIGTLRGFCVKITKKYLSRQELINAIEGKGHASRVPMAIGEIYFKINIDFTVIICYTTRRTMLRF